MHVFSPKVYYVRPLLVVHHCVPTLLYCSLRNCLTSVLCGRCLQNVFFSSRKFLSARSLDIALRAGLSCDRRSAAIPKCAVGSGGYELVYRVLVNWCFSSDMSCGQLSVILFRTAFCMVQYHVVSTLTALFDRFIRSRCSTSHKQHSASSCGFRVFFCLKSALVPCSILGTNFRYATCLYT